MLLNLSFFRAAPSRASSPSATAAGGSGRARIWTTTSTGAPPGERVDFFFAKVLTGHIVLKFKAVKQRKLYFVKLELGQFCKLNSFS